jgi:Mg2+ and Co2+ transporter CorA
MWQARKSASYLHRRLSQMLEVVRQLVTTNEREGGLHIRRETLYYLQDILDHITDMEQRLQTVQEGMARSQANYFAKISLDVTRVSNRMGLVMKRLTAAAAVVLPLSLVASTNMLHKGPDQTRPDPRRSHQTAHA